jgi:sporulation protein YlmC with PRC-barrel domain
MNEHYLDLVRQVLDRQIVDANHLNCGKVDDIEISLKGKPRITAILVGNGAASNRLPQLARYISRVFFGRRVVKIPWSEVSVITENIKLASDAKVYGLDERKGWTYNIVEKLPGAWKK